MKRSEMLKEARGFTVTELTGKINSGKKRLIELDQEKMLGKLSNVTEIRRVRKEVARLMTVRDEKITEQLTKGKNA